MFQYSSTMTNLSFLSDQFQKTVVSALVSDNASPRYGYGTKGIFQKGKLRLYNAFDRVQQLLIRDTLLRLDGIYARPKCIRNSNLA